MSYEMQQRHRTKKTSSFIYYVCIVQKQFLYLKCLIISLNQSLLGKHFLCAFSSTFGLFHYNLSKHPYISITKTLFPSRNGSQKHFQDTLNKTPERPPLQTVMLPVCRSRKRHIFYKARFIVTLKNNNDKVSGLASSRK